MGEAKRDLGTPQTPVRLRRTPLVSFPLCQRGIPGSSWNWGTPLILRRVYDRTLGKGALPLCTPLRSASVIPAELVLVKTGPVLADAGKRESRKRSPQDPLHKPPFNPLASHSLPTCLCEEPKATRQSRGVEIASPSPSPTSAVSNLDGQPFIRKVDTTFAEFSIAAEGVTPTSAAIWPAAWLVGRYTASG